MLLLFRTWWLHGINWAERCLCEASQFVFAWWWISRRLKKTRRERVVVLFRWLLWWTQFLGCGVWSTASIFLTHYTSAKNGARLGVGNRYYCMHELETRITRGVWTCRTTVVSRAQTAVCMLRAERRCPEQLRLYICTGMWNLCCNLHLIALPADLQIRAGDSSSRNLPIKIN